MSTHVLSLFDEGSSKGDTNLEQPYSRTAGHQDKDVFVLQPLKIAHLLVLVAAGVAYLSSQSSAAQSYVGLGFISGSVYCADTNLPARGAEVVFYPWPSKELQGRPSAVTFTDLEGRFHSGGLAPGQYVVSGDEDGYLEIGPNRLGDPSVRDSPDAQRELESRLTIITVIAHQTANVSLQIERGTEIRGTVVFDDGSPAINFPITFTNKGKGANDRDQPPSLFGTATRDYLDRTDGHGEFRIFGVFPGLYQLSVVIPSFSAADAVDDVTRNLATSSGALRIYVDGSFEPSRSQGIRIQRGDSERDIKITIPLAMLHTVQGEVALKGLGSLPPAAAIQLLYADTREVARIGIARDGRFQLNYVPEGTYILRAAASSLPSFPTIHSCPPDCQPLPQNAFGSFAEVPLVVVGDVSDLVVAVPPPPGNSP